MATLSNIEKQCLYLGRTSNVLKDTSCTIRLSLAAQWWQYTESSELQERTYFKIIVGAYCVSYLVIPRDIQTLDHINLKSWNQALYSFTRAPTLNIDGVCSIFRTLMEMIIMSLSPKQLYISRYRTFVKRYDFESND